MPISSHTTIPAANITRNGKAIVIRFVKPTPQGGWATYYAPAYFSSKSGLLVIIKTETKERQGIDRVVTRRKKEADKYLAKGKAAKAEFIRMSKGATRVQAELQDFVWERPAPEPEDCDDLSVSEDLSVEDNVVSIDTARAESEDEATVIEEAQEDALAAKSREELLILAASHLGHLPKEALAGLLAGMTSVK